jgi:hypothetical protein
MVLSMMIYRVLNNFSVLTKRQKLEATLLIFLVGSFIISGIYNYVLGRWPFGIYISQTMALYENSEPAFVIQYPKNWAAFSTPQGNHGDLEVVAFISTPGSFYPPNVFIAHRDFSSSSIADVLQWGQMRASRHRDYVPGEAIEHNTTTELGILFDYSGKEITLGITEDIRCFDWYTLDGISGYALSFCAKKDQWSEVETVFLNMINSFSTR